MAVVGVGIAVVATFVASSLYYMVLSPVEAKRLGDRAPDRGRPKPWQVVSELVRTAVVVTGFAWVGSHADLRDLPGGLGLAVVLWLSFPVVILLGSVTWERVSPVTAALHAGDWLLKLLLVATVLGLVH